ncbi:MAG: LysR family transcriptional regulator [Zetaproteobacteria bacterium CG02_land_8_20_14_3_00_50_9]|nr:MAG: LysR family transcriptional regulator [Zetaproteobacteria bacterium CG17_big_fil_post_rev_8_21_14_2_50_50_13]PIV29527.1 MAG: LysR family transcriptional regulator [Zetaproteobacteria bacterium CG02_land_8_20_14_3_00_50_9]PIY55732.1 MAG: LysR family transcriptional regulator [Zetaproteobacteria bacterium CG_4_10_14_0_8_um_filter_49_80]
MNWDDLRLFLAVAREGSISGGARALGVQHSTVSRRMRSLEQALGVRLIERKKSGYELTQAGENLKVAASNMEHQMLQVDSKLGGQDARLQGELRVTAINSMASTLLMPMFTGFNRQYPDVELHIMTSNKNISLVERNADIAIRLTNTPTDALIGKRIATVASTIYASRQYLAEQGKTAKKAEWIGVSCCGFHQTWTKKQSGPQRRHFNVDDTLLTLAALKQQQGLAYLPCFLGDQDPELLRVCPPDPQMHLGLWLLIHPDLKKTARVIAFCDYLINAMKQQEDLLAGILPSSARKPRQED